MGTQICIIEHAGDIDAFLSQSGSENFSFFPLCDTLTESLKTRELSILTVEKGRDFSQETYQRIDDFSMNLAEQWFRDNAIRSCQSHLGIDIASIHDRDFTYVVLGLVKTAFILRALIEKTRPDSVLYITPKNALPSQLLFTQDRWAYRTIRLLRNVVSARFKEIPIERDYKSKEARTTWRDHFKRFFGSCGTVTLSKHRHATRSGILFSSDINHCGTLMRLFTSSQEPLFYLRETQGIKNRLRLMPMRLTFLQANPQKNNRNRLNSELRQKLCDFQNREDSADLFTFDGMNFRTAFFQKCMEGFPFLFDRTIALADTFLDFLNHQPLKIIITDEDVCPFNKLLVHLARKRNILTVVLQHGSMGHRKGFTPLSSNYFFCWGQMSKKRLLNWGIEPERIHVTGSSRLDHHLEALNHPHKTKAPPRSSVLFVGSPYHESYRPDFAVSYVGKSSNQILFTSLKKLIKAFPDIDWIYKFHPRDQHTQEVENFFKKERLEGRITFLRKEPIWRYLLDSQWIVAQWSTVCDEAILLGKNLLIVNFESDSDMLPFIQDGVARGAKNPQEFETQFREMLKMSAGEQQALKQRLFAYRPEIYADAGGNSTQNIYNKIKQLLDQNS